MANKKNHISEEKQVNIELPESIDKALNKQRKERGQIKKRIFAAAMKLWLSLPASIQSQILDKSLPETEFEKLVTAIVDRHIEKSIPKYADEFCCTKKEAPKNEVT